MSKFLTREQVVLDFKFNILPSLIRIMGNKFESIEEYWEMNLDGLLKDNQISTSQREKWKITAKELELSE